MSNLHQPGEVLLQVQGLETAYGESQVLFGIDFSIRAGETATLLGRNGMGKTTTIRSLLGLTRARAGSVHFRGERIDNMATDRIARMGIALVPEGRQIFPNLTVKENLVAIAANRRGASEPWTLDRVYALFPRLAERAGNMGNQLSGGEQQMLAIGRAIMSRPRLLLLDEPSMGLAPIVVQTIFEVIRVINAAGVTVLLVEQNARAALELANRAYVMESGAIVMTGDAKELLHDPRVRAAYLGEGAEQ